MIPNAKTLATSATSTVALPLNVDGHNHIIFTQRLSSHAAIQVHLSRADTKTKKVLLGPHFMVVTVAPSCTYPRFSVRVMGDALSHVLLKQSPDKKEWQGLFELPISGSYLLDARWYGCAVRPATVSFASLVEPIYFQSEDSLHAIDSTTREQSDYARQLFANGTAWLSSRSIQRGDSKLPPYIWMKVRDVMPGPSTFVRTSTSLVHQGSALGPGGYYRFGEVGNYELVCFMGGQTMQKIWRAFLDMRGQLFAYQRPFKFHYYDIHSFTSPDAHWDDDTRRRLRKCKHILLSLDDFNQMLSRQEYAKQVTRFVNVHLQNVMPDKSFPIWVFSVNEPPMIATNCFHPTLPRTTDHPCNDVLKELFRPEADTFHERIHFLDNTDLSLPQFETNQEDVFANIALRVFVVVGKGVSVWRHMGQSGKENGLHRNGSVEPNFELVPYDGWRNV
ncbi:hypothetical protein MPSEU_000424500 [Mayamaea pseudoterrestris]|nr:hypothetical protein MPSEU_000424500 [Mayamaea pseudoterrestris]